MMSEKNYLIDAHAWISYLEGDKQGEKVYQILQENENIFVIPITIAEVISKVKRKNSNTEIAYNSIITNAKIVETTPKIAKEAGLFHAKIREKISNFGVVDSILLITARTIGAKIVTGDNHFKEFDEAIVLTS